MAYELFTVHNHRVSGIVPALKSNNNISNFCQMVDDLSFTLITPLRSDDYDISHLISPYISILNIS
jgi:hypothetical protein